MMNRMVLAAIGAAIAAAPAAAQPMSPAAYVRAAGAGDLYETQSSRLVLTSTKNPAIRSFAQMMIQQHAKSTAEVKAAAMKAGMKPMPAMLTPPQSEMMRQLRAAAGTARDQLYLAQQKQAHDEALALHSGYAADGGSAPLKMAAGKIAPVVQTHIDRLATM